MADKLRRYAYGMKEIVDLSVSDVVITSPDTDSIASTILTLDLAHMVCLRGSRSVMGPGNSSPSPSPIPPEGIWTVKNGDPSIVSAVGDSIMVSVDLESVFSSLPGDATQSQKYLAQQDASLSIYSALAEALQVPYTVYVVGGMALGRKFEMGLFMVGADSSISEFDSFAEMLNSLR